MSFNNTNPSVESTTTDSLPTPILILQKNITVRAHHISDAEALAAQGNNRKIWLNMTDHFPHPYTPSNAETWINMCADPSNFIPLTLPAPKSDTSTDNTLTTNTIRSNYAICLDNKPIGGIGLDKSSPYRHVLTMGYWLGEEHWGRGYATMVAGAFLKWIFDTFPYCLRVFADAYGWNPGSMAVLKKIGMQMEGTMRMAVFKDGKYTDMVLFGIIRPGFVPEEAGADVNAK